MKLTDLPTDGPYGLDCIDYLTQVGSHAYGVATEDSDEDFYGFLTPDIGTIFPHTRGEILGFGRQNQRFEQWQLNKPADITIYSIVKFFQLCMENNPNMVDALFTPDRCVIHMTEAGEHVRENRNIFLHKGSYHKFRGYAHAQMSKLKAKTAHENPKRAASIQEHGYDTKYAYHLMRLLLETQEILKDHTLTLDKNAVLLGYIREGAYPFDILENEFNVHLADLEELYKKSTLRYEPDQHAIKRLLVECLEMRFGSLSSIGFQL
jgi:predicted nucleotidyltransferase